MLPLAAACPASSPHHTPPIPLKIPLATTTRNPLHGRTYSPLSPVLIVSTLSISSRPHVAGPPPLDSLTPFLFLHAAPLPQGLWRTVVCEGGEVQQWPRGTVRIALCRRPVASSHLSGSARDAFLPLRGFSTFLSFRLSQLWDFLPDSCSTKRPWAKLTGKSPYCKSRHWSTNLPCRKTL